MSSRYLSPLRYPGGKARMAPFLVDLFWHQLQSPLDIEIWIEPFAGGAGAALSAVMEHSVPEAWLVECNPALAVFWRACITQPERLARAVESTTPTLGEFYAAREAVAAAQGGYQPALTELEGDEEIRLAMAAFVLNRCSRSGMVSAKVGPIGGKAQAGPDTLTARWNPASLAGRIRRIGDHADQLKLLEGDGLTYLEDLPGSGIEHEVFVFADPPYLAMGNDLYATGMNDAQHRRLSEALQELPSPWAATYDAHPGVLDLYPTLDVWEFDIPHTTNRQVIGTEYLVTGPWLAIPPTMPNPLGKGTIRKVQTYRDDGRTRPGWEACPLCS